jgi:radical SAM-linked protein
VSPYKYRIRFSKQGTLRYIGHLDLLRVFQQTLRRAGLPLAFSQGFNPHILLSFALPLPLGMESVNDYADMALVESLPGPYITECLNAHAPGGLRIAAAAGTEPKPGVAALVSAADYAWDLNINHSARDALLSVLNEPALILPKKTKSGVKYTDVRPDIFDLRFDVRGF